MMNLTTVNTAADLAAVLTTQGIQVAPKAGTPLAKLTQTILGAGLGMLTGVTAEEPENKVIDPSWATLMVEHSRVTLPDGTPNEFQAHLTLLVDEIRNSVSGTIDFSRNVVNPIIKDVCDKISAAMDLASQGGSLAQTRDGARFALSNGSMVVNITEEGPDSIYLDSVTEQEADARLRTPYQNITSPVLFPEMSSVELMEHLESNAKTDFQRDVIEKIKSMDNGYDELLAIYHNSYCFRPGRVNATDIRSLTNDMSLRPLVILAIGTIFIDNIPEGTTGSATNIENAMGAWITQLKNIIAINIEVYKQALSQKSIVLASYNHNFETNITVNKENYRSYLEEGGSTEALIGATFDDRNYDFDNLLQRQQDYESIYERRLAEAVSFNEANRLTIFKNVLRQEVYDHIFNCPEDAIRPVAPSEARAELDNWMKKIYIDALDRPHETVRSVVCNTLFLGTDAEEILVNIDHLCDKDDNLSIRDASALVILDYLTKFMVSQMDVKRTV